MENNSELYNDILIVGYGNIGTHIHKELEGAGKISIQDKYKPEYMLSYTKAFNFAFICVPTEMKEDGSVDITEVENSVMNTNAKIIIIKSTVPIGTCQYLKDKYEKEIVFSPEYYGTTIHCPTSPNFLILAGDKKNTRKVAELYQRVKTSKFRITFTDYKTAELAKYMENCFLALKVTFCSEFYDIAQQYGISYPELREIFIQDERMGDSHTYVNPKETYYNSHCLNKDIPGLISQTDRALLMEAMHKINQDKKSGLIRYDRPKKELPDCNKCGDYEYCAFKYDKCTGFIPGPESYE